VAIHLCGLPEGGVALRRRRAGNPFLCLALLRVGFAEPPESPRALVRSCRTVSPLPVPVARPSAVCFLWHFPSGHPDWPLASTLPCGVPTFLDPVDAGPRPPGRLTALILPQPPPERTGDTSGRSDHRIRHQFGSVGANW
jgi:hypothetical protein